MSAQLPPPESHASILIRRWIIIIFVLTLAIVGVPSWYYTTSIYRAPLAYDQMDYYDKNIINEMQVENSIYLDIGDEFPDLVPATQLLIDQKLGQKGVRGWHIQLHQGCVSGEYCLNLKLDESTAYWVSEYSRDITISYTEHILAGNALPDMVASLLLEIFQQEIEMFKNFKNPSQKVVAYSPQYHVTFSLFAQGGAPISWDITEALESY